MHYFQSAGITLFSTEHILCLCVCLCVCLSVCLSQEGDLSFCVRSAQRGGAASQADDTLISAVREETVR